MEYISRYTFTPMLQTSVSVAIGRGDKRHNLFISIKAAADGTLHAYAGQTWCGSQRASSGWHSPIIDGPVNCEKCLARPPRGTVPAADVLEVTHGRLSVKADVTIIERTEPA